MPTMVSFKPTPANPGVGVANDQICEQGFFIDSKFELDL